MGSELEGGAGPIPASPAGWRAASGEDDPERERRGTDAALTRVQQQQYQQQKNDIFLHKRIPFHYMCLFYRKSKGKSTF